MAKIAVFLILMCSVVHAELPAFAPFLVQPYVYFVKGSQWAMSWAYPQGLSFDSQVHLKIDGTEQTIRGEFHDGLYTAFLPLPACNFGMVTYKVDGQKKDTPINNIPCPNFTGPTRLTFMADTQEGVQHDRVFAQQVAHFDSAAVLIGGDLVQNGSVYDEWINFFDALNPALQSQVLLPAVGNHEYRHDKNVPYWEHFFQTKASEEFYAVDVGPVHVIALNSCFTDDPALRVKQLNWLESELSKPSRWKVVFFHHPLYSRSVMYTREYPRKEYKALIKDYQPLFENHNVDLVLNGHTHIYEHSQKSGVHYMTMGPAGGIFGIYGTKSQYILETHMMRTILEMEASQTELRAVTSRITGAHVGELILKK